MKQLFLRTRINYFALIVLTLLLIGNITSIIYIVSYGAVADGIEDKTTELSQISQSLRDRLVAETSLNNISDKASSAGFDKASQKIYIDSMEAVAQAQN